MSFNYQKAYCVHAVPSYEALPHHVKDIHSKVRALIGDLQQDRTLKIPMTDAIRAFMEELSTKELAGMARASNFVGHWQPSAFPVLWANSKGESWKVSNCADQILRERLAPLPSCVEVHEGKLRVTFSSRDCWTWEEFGLATAENMAIFTECNLPFGETTLHESAAKLKKLTNDLWPDVDTVPVNDMYREYLSLQREANKKKIEKQFSDKIQGLKNGMVNAQKEIDFLLACNEKDISTDNVIHYSHTSTFCFGWRDKLTADEKTQLEDTLGDIATTYNVEFKTV